MLSVCQLPIYFDATDISLKDHCFSTTHSLTHTVTLAHSHTPGQSSYFSISSIMHDSIGDSTIKMPFVQIYIDHNFASITRHISPGMRLNLKDNWSDSSDSDLILIPFHFPRSQLKKETSSVFIGPAFSFTCLLLLLHYSSEGKHKERQTETHWYNVYRFWCRGNIAAVSNGKTK